MAEPKYRQILRSLQDKIRRGVYPPGSRLPGHLTLAREYNVSVITSNRALAELEQIGIVERRRRSGTFVLASPRAISDIFMIVSGPLDEENLQFFDYWRGVIAQAERIGIAVQTVQDTDAKLSSRIGIDRFAGQAVIFLGVPKNHVLRGLRQSQIPHVGLGRHSDPLTSVVMEDRRSTAAALVKALIADGHRRIGFIGNLSADNHRLARDGYLEGTQSLGLGHRYIRDASESTILAVVRDLLAEDLALDGLIVMGGRLPIAALPIVLNHPRRPALAVLTENASVLQLGSIAYVGYYSQCEAGKMAVDLLGELAAGSLTPPVIRYVPYHIFRPKDKS